MDTGNIINLSVRILMFINTYAGSDTWYGKNVLNRNTLIDVRVYWLL